MGQTIAQKILAKKSGRGSVEVGEIVEVRPDHVLSHDNTAAISKKFAQLPIKRVLDPEQPVIILDHTVPPSTAAYANNHKLIREFVQKNGIKHFYDVGRGICHQVLVEEGFAYPGALILGADSHTTTYGALGAASAGIGRSEVAAIWATGKMWLRVPESMLIKIYGDFPFGTTSKDLILKIIGDIGADGALYRSVEFAGEGIRNMSVASRMVLANMSVEMGAKFGIVHPDERVEEFLSDKTQIKYEHILPDPDAQYVEVLNYNLDELEPMVAMPHTVDNVAPVADVVGTKVNQVFFGSCTNGRVEDFHMAASIIAGRRVANGVRMLAFPASSKVLSEIIADGTAKKLVNAGVILMNPGCGPCLGAHEGVLADDEICISTANRNFKGRMGNPNAFIYLASPYTAAAAAVAGEIVDPRELL